MKQFDFNKVSEVLDYMSSTGIEHINTTCGVTISLVEEGKINTYMIDKGDRFPIVREDKEEFLKEVAKWYLEGDKN